MPRQLAIYGRDLLIRDLVAHALEGHAVVLCGPRGVGASAVLDAVARDITTCGRPVARAPRIAELADLTHALAVAYLPTEGCAPPAERRLALAAARRCPGALLVDRIERASAQVRRDVRELSVGGTGSLFAAAVDHPRDRVRVRAMRLAHREVAIPPLDLSSMRKILASQLVPEAAQRLEPDDRERLLRAASGRPGVLVRMVARLGDSRYWRATHLMIEPLRADVIAADHD